ncbi:homoserine kinase [Pseudidiomarina sp. YC-516-91]|uniref:homoserine kinase n=1 Tax=Pseudidiomarina salilacus TaxID=3384452 RepID=UPI003984C64C
MQKTYYAPASIGNFSVGFDTLGLALQPRDGSLLGDRLSIEPATKATKTTVSELKVTGRYAHQLPADPQQNLVNKCWQQFRATVAEPKNQEPLPELKLTLHKELPVGSGLGSSACSIVATLYALNDYFDQPLSQQQLLQLMARLEGQTSNAMHLDNIAPAYFGGLQLMATDAQRLCRQLPWFAHWSVVVSYPGTVLNTATARQVIPAQLPLPTAIQAAQNLASFVHGLHSQDETLALSALEDCLAEPCRLQLIPQLTTLRQQAQQLGIAHLGISGAGPTLFALCRNDAQAAQVKQLLETQYQQNADAMTVHCRPDPNGARQLAAHEHPEPAKESAHVAR